MFFLGYSA